jgi:hypothetical protein
MTLELGEAQYARLLALAAERGEEGVSSVVQEAIDRHLVATESAGRGDALRTALEAIGSVSDETAEGLSAVRDELRSRWR